MPPLRGSTLPCLTHLTFCLSSLLPHALPQEAPAVSPSSPTNLPGLHSSSCSIISQAKPDPWVWGKSLHPTFHLHPIHFPLLLFTHKIIRHHHGPSLPIFNFIQLVTLLQFSKEI
ncbi:hypothetical protein BKA61DRAFT_609080, partial [Leptodontidium sp. MPI-SDFR-AT-0119]